MAFVGEVRALTRALSSRKELAVSLTSSLLATQAGLRIRINRVSGSGSRSAKMNHKSRKIFFNSSCFELLDGLLRAKGFFYNLDVLYGGLGIGKFFSLDPKTI